MKKRKGPVDTRVAHDAISLKRRTIELEAKRLCHSSTSSNALRVPGLLAFAFTLLVVKRSLGSIAAHLQPPATNLPSPLVDLTTDKGPPQLALYSRDTPANAAIREYLKVSWLNDQTGVTWHGTEDELARAYKHERRRWSRGLPCSRTSPQPAQPSPDTRIATDTAFTLCEPCEFFSTMHAWHACRLSLFLSAKSSTHELAGEEMSETMSASTVFAATVPAAATALCEPGEFFGTTHAWHAC